MTTLKQYWTDEVTRIGNALSDTQSKLAALRTAVMTAETGQRSTADSVRSQRDAVAAARRALAAIPMPADGDPLLDAMESALVALHAAQAALANDECRLLEMRAELARTEQRAAQLGADLVAAQQALDKETLAADARNSLIGRLTTALPALVSDATDALNTHQATASARVESEFPTSATASKNFLARARARRALVQAIAASATGVEDAAYAASNTALAKAQRDFDATVAAAQALADAPGQLVADTATLARLAALPAPNPPTSYSILTRWQHDLLHDSSKKTKRETVLAKLTAVDDARSQVIAAQAAYDNALHAAMKAEPDKTVAQLETDIAAVSAAKTALDAKLASLATARGDYTALSAGDRQTLDEWFAAAPDTLWDALDSLDGAVARLEQLKAAPALSTVTTALDTAESALEAALRAVRLDGRQTAGAQRAGQRAAALLDAQRNTAAARATAMARSDALF